MGSEPNSTISTEGINTKKQIITWNGAKSFVNKSFFKKALILKVQ
jgi:hypothetical protein